MPVNKKKMASLKKQYGAKRGEDIYYAMENKKKKKKARKKK
jgi:hypothetical protein